MDREFGSATIGFILSRLLAARVFVHGWRRFQRSRLLMLLLFVMRGLSGLASRQALGTGPALLNLVLHERVDDIAIGDNYALRSLALRTVLRGLIFLVYR